MKYRPGSSVVIAWFGLLAVDVIMRFAGFYRLCETVRKFPIQEEPVLDPKMQKIICASVDKAATFYFKPVRCLQRSATATCLLRLFGVPAQMVIAVQKTPFFAHAWVENEGKVLNDGPAVQRYFQVLERC